jgi:hypothetical protein
VTKIRTAESQDFCKEETATRIHVSCRFWIYLKPSAFLMQHISDAIELSIFHHYECPTTNGFGISFDFWIFTASFEF